MAKIMNLEEILETLKGIDPSRDILPAIEAGFVAYSKGRVVVPPVGELIFDDPPGETHIKYGYIRNDDHFAIKIASSFRGNAGRGLNACQGLILLLSQKTGEPVCILLDEGHLTQVRTAAAGAVVARHFAPRNIRRVGVFGAGTQARMQIEYLRYVRPVPEVIAWCQNQEEAASYRAHMEGLGFRTATTFDPEEVASTCNLIVTATPSHRPLLAAGQIRKGTHITAMGSDTAEKQELDPEILRLADRLVVDSLSQGRLRGEMFKALQAGAIAEAKPVELGTAIADPGLHRQSDDEITVADLTGVAVQDIQIAKMVWEAAGRTAGGGGRNLGNGCCAPKRGV